ncbi:MAG: hypothetical protein GF393_02600, partial [Armatimonadia bacterium]|nr:hypothetical protein [Armatimonadia bacterium]
SQMLLMSVIALTFVFAGCGGGGNQTVGPPTSPDAQPSERTVGPFVIQTAASTDVNVQNIANRNGAAFVSLSTTSGAMDYIATIEMMEQLVFGSNRDSSGFEIYMSDFFARNIVRLTTNSDDGFGPEWSPDGTRIAYSLGTPTSYDIVVMDSDGSNQQNFTNTASDVETSPTWSPNGRWIGYISDESGDDELYRMDSDGGKQERLTSTGDSKSGVMWNPLADSLIFGAAGTFGLEINTCTAEGDNITMVADTGTDARSPVWHPNGSDFAYSALVGGDYDIFISGPAKDPERIAGGDGSDDVPVFSSDGEWLIFVSSRTGSSNLFARKLVPPYTLLQLTSDSHAYLAPHLGSPVPTETRVLVGPNGADLGFDPVHGAANAAVAVFDENGYLNFVRLGIPPASAGSLEVTPLADTGDRLVGVIWSAPDMFYVEQDSGINEEPTIWDLSGRTSRSILLYLDAETGKLVSILDLDDDTTTAAAGHAAAISHEHSDADTIARGDFSAVYGPDGELVAEGEIGAVEIDAQRGVVRAY